MISVFNNVEGKITESWLVKEESIFFLREESKIYRERNISKNLRTRAKMKTRRIARSGERTFSKNGRIIEGNLQANLEEYENDVLEQRSSQF